MRLFIVIWFGQIISLIGSFLTSFALSIWVYQRTGSATDLASQDLRNWYSAIALSCVPAHGNRHLPVGWWVGRPLESPLLYDCQ